MFDNTSDIKLRSLITLLIIFCEGFVSVAIEILTIRQLIPFAGNSVIITSLIIGTFLLFLAFGYYSGGKHTANFRYYLKRNFLFAAIFIAVGLNYFFIYCFFSFGESLLWQKTLLVLSLYLLTITSPLTYLLGQTVPITMNLVKQEELAGMIGGKVLFLSTVGSFFGSIFTSLLLMEYFGVAATVFINFLLMLGLVLLLSENKKSFLINCFIALILIPACYNANIGLESKTFVATNNYANYEIKDVYMASTPYIPGKILKINNSYSSYLDVENTAFPYIEYIKKILFSDLKLKGKNILIIGAGGFTLSAGHNPSNHFTYVDIDKNIGAIAEKGFIEKINGNFIGEDARIYLRHNKSLFDVIINDTFNGTLAIPEQLLTADYFNLIKNNLSQNGIAIFNIIADPFLADNYSKRIDTTLRSVFGSCTVSPLQYTHQLTNLIYVCVNTPNQSDHVKYSDNLTSATMDFFLIKGNQNE